MSRATRLLDLLQLLRRYRQPVSGHALAGELNISLRSLYRDIETLRGQGAHIEGEAGIGYVLRPGMMLPPLMFTPEEMEAILLGSKWVAQRADARLGEAAENALAKIRAVLPADMAEMLDAGGLLVGKGAPIIAGTIDLALVREALRKERKLMIGYADGKGAVTDRTVWPVALGFFDQVRMLAAWCELRQDYRHFRIDRIRTASLVDERPPRRRRVMFKEWREREGLGEQS